MNRHNAMVKWADYTFLPWVKVQGDDFYELTSHSTWRKPIIWNRKSEREAANVKSLGADPPPRPRVFCLSPSDVFDPEIPIDWLRCLIKLIDDTPNLDWLLLTKRPEKIVSRVDKALCDEHENVKARFFRNVWLGVTVENQSSADKRIPVLLDIPANKRFLSMDPLLGPVNLGRHALPIYREADEVRMLNASRQMIGIRSGQGYVRHDGRGPWIDWVIAGGVPSDVGWFVSIIDQCRAADVPFMVLNGGPVRGA